MRIGLWKSKKTKQKDEPKHFVFRHKRSKETKVEQRRLGRSTINRR